MIDRNKIVTRSIIGLGILLSIMSFQHQINTEDLVGLEVKGDFNGDKKIEEARSGPIRQFYPDKNIDGVGWMAQFEDSTIKELTLGCCLSYMVNEGDLNNDGADELSIYAYSGNMADCNYYYSTYTLTKKGWQKIIGPFVVANGCEGFQSENLLSKVTKDEKGAVYYQVDTLGKSVKKRAF